MFEFAWSTTTRKTITSITLAAGLIAGLGSAVDAWPKLEPYWIAQRYWVNKQILAQNTQLKPVLEQLQKNDLARQKGDLERQQRLLEQEKAQWAIKLPTEQDAQTRGMIQDRLNKIDAETRKVQEDIKNLK